jgi:hypothetical protein
MRLQQALLQLLLLVCQCLDGLHNKQQDKESCDGLSMMS